MSKKLRARILIVCLLALLVGFTAWWSRNTKPEGATPKAAADASELNVPPATPAVPAASQQGGNFDYFSPEMRQLVAKLDRGEPVRLALGEAAAKTYYTAPTRVTTDTFKISTGVATVMPASYRVYTGYEFLPSGAKGDHLSIAVVNDAVAMALITPTGEYRIERSELSGKLEALRLRDVAERGVDSAEENCRTLPNGAHIITYSAATAHQIPVSLPVTFDYSATAGVDPSLAAVDQSSSSSSTESVDHPYFRFGAQYDASLKDMTVIQVMAKAATGLGTASNLSSKAALAISVAGTSADIWPRQLGLRYLMSELIMIASDSTEADPAPSTNPVPNPNPADTFYDLSYQQGVFVNWIKTHRPYSVYRQGHSSCFCVIPGGVAGLASGIGIYGSSDSSVTIEERMGNFCVHNHEIGHCLGAPHSTGGLMNPSVSTYESLYAQVGTSSPLMTAAKYVYNYLSGTNLKGLSGPAPLRKADELPFGVGDTVTTALNTPVTFSPLTNDKTSVLGGSVNVLSLVEVGQVFPVAAGKAVVSGNTIIFTPATGFTGRAWFSYTLRGNVGNSGQGWLHNANVVVTVGGNATNPTLFPALDLQHDYIRTDFSVPVRLNPLLNDEAQGRLWAGDVDVLLSATDTTAESYSEKAFTLVSAVVQAGNGSVTLETRTLLSTVNSVEKNTGYLVYTPGANEPSEVIIKYTVRDALGNTADAYIALARSGFNYPPIAGPQSVSVAENTPRFITVEASDGEGVALTYSVVTPPSHGILSGTVPNLIYTPTTNYTGSDGFTFKANDGTQDSNIATVTLTVAPNIAPVATAMAISTDEDTATAFVLAGTDAENGTLTYAVLTQPAHGTLTGSAPNLTYTPASNYNGSDSFTFQVNDGYVNSSPATVSINVIPVNDAPVAVLSVDRPMAVTGATVNFTASASSDVDGTVVAYNINFGDGQSATTATAAHVYAATGFYTAVLTVTDNTQPVGATGTTTLGVTVVGADTIAADGLESGTTSGGIGWTGAWVLGADTTVSSLESPSSGSYHLRMLKAGSAVRTVDLSARSGSRPVLTFNWKANSLDSSNETAKVEVYDGKWYTVLLVVNGQDTNVYQSASIDLSGYNMISNFQVRASIQGSATDDYFYLDNIQIKSSQSTNVAPVTNSQNLTTAEDTAKAITLTASDANGDALTYAIATPPARGTLTGTAPNLTYTPAANYNGSDSFDYIVTDPLMSIAKGTVSLTVTPVNDAPVANNQSVPTALNTAALITLSATDVDGDALSYQIVSGVSHGTISLSGRGVTYTPTTGYSGSDSFTFKVNDGLVDSNVATVDLSVGVTSLPVTAGLALWLDASQLTGLTNGQQVNTWTDMSGLGNHAVRQSTSSTGNPSFVTNIINGKPVLRFVSGTTITGDYFKFTRINTIRSVFWVVKENAELTDWHFLLGDDTTYHFHRNQSKANGPLWEPLYADANVLNGTTKLMGTQVNGTTTALPSAQFQLISLVTTGNVQANQITQDRSSHGSWQGDIAEIIIYNTALSATDEAKVGAYLTAKYNLTTAYTVLNRTPVANAQSLAAIAGTASPITLTATDADNDSLTYSVVAQPARGVLAGTAPALTYTPTAGYSGSDSFTFKANDGTVDSAVATVTLTVRNNNAPVANAQSVTTAEDTSKAIVLSATDADSDPLNYTIVTAPAHGTFTGTAPNLTYVPAANYNGSDSFTFRAWDGYANSNIATVSITVTAVNDAPVAVAHSAATFIQTPVQLLLAGTDVDGNRLTYSVVAQPARGTLSGTAPNLTYTPSAGFGGTDTFTFKVNDGTVDSSVATVTLTVGTAVTYNFNNGLQGWTIISQNTTGTGPQLMVSSTSEQGLMTFPVLTTRSDTDGGVYNGDAAHPVLVARSPSFTISSGALITFDSAGGSSVNAVAPALGSGAYNSNALGVSLVDATTGSRVLSVKTTNELAKSTYTLDPSAFANNGRSYYLEVVDNYTGGWGYCEWDNFNIQASVALPLISIAATDALATEGTPATDTSTFTVTRSGVTTGVTTVGLTYTGTATSGTDFITLPTSVTFAAGETTQTITVTPISDSLVEGSESVIASLTAGNGYMIDAAGSATVAIVDAPGSKTWNGAGADTNWGTTANWAGGMTPIANDTLNFAGTTRATNINNLTTDTPFAALNFNNTATGNFSLSGNRITLAGNITSATASGSLSDNSSVPMILSGTSTITTNTNHSLTLSGIISGTGGLTKAGSANLTLRAASTYTGDVNINAGTLKVAYVAQVTNPVVSGLGNPQVARNIYVNSGANLSFDAHCPLGNNASGTIAASLIINGGSVLNPNASTTLGPVTLNGGTMTAGTGNSIYGYAYGFLNGSITVGGSAASTLGGAGTTYSIYKLMASTVTFTVADATSSTAADLIVSAPLVGSGNLVKAGAGTMQLSAVNTYTGNTTVSAGTLSTSNACLADASSVYLGTGATLDLNFSGTDTITKLFINGVMQNQGTWGSLTSSATNKTSQITGTGQLSATGGRVVPTITTVPTASAIYYGQALNYSILTGGAASVPGGFAWTSPNVVPAIGSSSQAFIFTPTDSVNYGPVTGTVSVTVNQPAPTVTTLPTASAITYGQTLAASTLTGGAASVPGSFAWTSPSTLPNAGTPSQGFTFTPTDTVNYSKATGTINVQVNKATSTVTTVPTASAITSGQTLASSTLTGGAASVPGSFAWTTANTAPAAGTASQSFTFNPTDAVNYATATGAVSVTVNKPVPTITTAPTASAITYPQPLASSTLTSGAASVPGTFAWTNPSAIPSVTSAQSVTFTPTDSVTYATATTTTSVTVTVGSYTWNGASLADANWNTAANWVGGSVPPANKLLIFTGTTRTTNVNDLTADTNVAGLSFTNTTAGQAFSLSGNRLALGGDITLATAAGAISDSLSLPLIVSGNRTITANTNHNLTLSGNITGTGSLTKAGAGTLTLSGNNTFSGNFTLNGGSVSVSSPAALGTGTLGLSVTGATTLTFTGGGNVANTINLGTGSTTIYASQGDLTPLVFANAGGTAGTGTRSLELRGPSVAVNDFQSLITDGAGLTNFDKIGTGNWKLSNDNNSFTGAFAIYQGLLSITSLANVGSVSAAGTGTTTPAIQMGQGNTGAILNYVGSGNSTTNRSIVIGSGTGSAIHTGGATITNNGTGTLVFTATVFNPLVASTMANRTLTLGGNNNGVNGVQGTIQDNAVTTGVVALAKTDAGKWVLSGNNTYTGNTTISGGTLQLAKSASLYSGNTTRWTAANIKVASGGTLALNVGGTGEFGTSHVATLLTNLGGANGSTAGGLAAESTIAFDTTNASGGTFTIPDQIANPTGVGGGALGVSKFGANALVLGNTNNAYSGHTTVTGGTLSLVGPSLADAADVAISVGAILNLNFSGTDTIARLFIDGVEQSQGTWGSLTSSASNKTASIIGNGILNVTAGVVKTTPTIAIPPTASAITYGRTLASSTLSGGVASVPGTFAFTTPATAPDAGTSSQSYTFTPTDAVNYSPVTGTVSVTVSAAGYPSWVGDYNWAGGDSSPTGDPDGDGLENLIEYATGQNPTLASANPITFSEVEVSGSTYLQLSVSRNPAVSNVLIEGLSAGTLTDSGAWSTGTTVTVTNTPSVFTVRDSLPKAENIKRFLRLRFTLQP